MRPGEFSTGYAHPGLGQMSPDSKSREAKDQYCTSLDNLANFIEAGISVALFFAFSNVEENCGVDAVRCLRYYLDH